ncbi:tRNA (adenosine(37)-N6)-threonylcarbamoyltransferase complex dimerization subunit type 1 TsaB [Candidatus Gracilibacteria bacterium]|nr:tRNA (adenosine(37)-N6)-threonylcarbamoyltransferase complex dimerization subunit type 1 TsaB [Candidatus Gracilibacteria bacterium]
MLLGINTASSHSSFILIKEGKILAGEQWQSHNDEAEKLMPLIDETLRAQSLTYQNLTQIAVITGPGSFTGLRVGLTVANTLAHLLKIPVVPINTFEYWHALSDLPILVFAGRGAVYYSKSLDAEPQILNLDEARALNLKESAGDITEDQIAALQIHFHSAKDWLADFQKVLAAQDWPSTTFAQPLYVKQPEITASKK